MHRTDTGRCLMVFCISGYSSPVIPQSSKQYIWATTRDVAGAVTSAIQNSRNRSLQGMTSKISQDGIHESTVRLPGECTPIRMSGLTLSTCCDALLRPVSGNRGPMRLAAILRHWQQHCRFSCSPVTARLLICVHVAWRWLVP